VKLISLSLIIYGTPVPQGSMRAFYKTGMRHAVITSDNKKTKPWKQEIAGAAAEAMADRKLDPIAGQPIAVSCTFFFDRPKSLRKSVLAKMTKPDLDKLLRSALDALTGTVFKDDAQVVSVVMEKRFDATPRAILTITAGDPGIA
jgi:Holliday junction resolvase RusA-like endonuclease